MCISTTKRFILAIMVILSMLSCGGSESKTFEINGTWSLMPREYFESAALKAKMFGWGAGLSIPNTFMEIDTINKTIYIPGLFMLDIVSVEINKDNEYAITAHFKNDNFDVVYLIHILTDNRMWYEYIGEGELGGDCGERNIYYRISGPVK